MSEESFISEVFSFDHAFPIILVDYHYLHITSFPRFVICHLVWFHPLLSLQVPCLLFSPALLCFGVRDISKLVNFKGKGLFYTFAFLTFGSFSLFHYK